MRSLYLLRSVPGAGKSTLADELAEGYGDIICCADDYHMVDGIYMFSPDKLGFAHKSCQGKCENLMINDSPRVIIANTNTSDKDMNPYIILAKKYNYKVFSLVVENRHGGSDIHNVPEEALNRMSDNIRRTLKLT